MAVGAVSAAPSAEGATVTLLRDMSVGDALRELLASNAVCVSKAGEEVFYVRIEPSKTQAEANLVGAEDMVCISLADLLASPRHMPLECLIDSDNEECSLYEFAPVPYASRSIVAELTSRLPWLLGLLGCLTVSSAILEFYDDILQRNLVIAFYLTALIGCGGNSGSQASALVLQALASGDVVPNFKDGLMVVTKEFLVSVGIAALLTIGVVARILVVGGSMQDAAIVGVAMAVTVIFSVLFGAVTPLVLQRLGADPAKVSGPLLSTTIDIFGVLIICVVAEILEKMGLFS